MAIGNIRLWIAAMLLIAPIAATANFAIFQVTSEVPSIGYNIVTDGAAACNGDVQVVTKTITISSGTKNLSATTNTWLIGDLGKAIVVPGAGGSGGNLVTTIATFTDAQHVVLSDNASTSLSGASKLITFGTNDAPQFAAFNAWALANQGSLRVVLTVPTGHKCQFLNNAGADFTAGINNLLISGYGATLTNAGLTAGDANFNFGVGGICHVGLTDSSGCSARIQTANAGVSSVILTSASFGAGYISRFSVGQYVIITGFDLQGLWNAPFGYPPNLHYFQFAKITSLDTGTGTIGLDATLKYTYESTWPNFNSGDGSEADAGGPATIYALDSQWGTTVEIDGLVIDQTNVQINARGRTRIFRDVTVNGSNCIAPSQNVTWQFVNSDLSSCNIEADKLVTLVSISGNSLGTIAFQSSSVDEFDLANVTVTGSIEGTPKKFVGSGSTIATLALGATSFGRTDEVVCASCVINSLQYNSVTETIDASWTMSGGIITIANTLSSGGNQNQERWAIPGTNEFWRDASGNELLFRIIDVTQDSTNTYIQTNLAGGFPMFSGSNPTAILVHPAPKFTCTSCTGSDTQIASLTQAPPATPLYSYQTYTYTGVVGTAPQVAFNMWGNLSQININVTNAYVGASTPVLHLTQFDNWSMINSSNTHVDWNSSGGGPAVNVKSVGNRQIALSGVTCPSGVCIGDSGMAAPDATVSWFNGTPGAGSVFSQDVSGVCPGANCPSVTVTIQTDQGVVNP